MEVIVHGISNSHSNLTPGVFYTALPDGTISEIVLGSTYYLYLSNLPSVGRALSDFEIFVS